MEKTTSNDVMSQEETEEIHKELKFEFTTNTQFVRAKKTACEVIELSNASKEALKSSVDLYTRGAQERSLHIEKTDECILPKETSCKK